MALCTTSAIVLRTTAFGDTSLVVHVLTKEHGRIGLMARGARKKPGALAPFQSGSLTFYNKAGRDLQGFREFAVREPRLGLARAMDRFNGAALMVELILRTSGEDASGQSFEALDMALSGMEQVADDQVWSRILAGAWEIVGTLGYAPDMAACGSCGRAAQDSEMFRFSLKEGGVVCERCSTPALPRLGPGARKQLSAFLNGTHGTSSMIGDSPMVLEDAHRRPHLILLGDFVTYHVTGDPPLKSLTGLMELLVR